MADKAVDIGAAQTLPREEIIDRRLQLCLHQARDVAREDGLQPVIGDIPPHDIEAPGPCVLTRCDDRRALACAVAAEQPGSGAVAEQRGRNDIAFRQIVAPERERAQFDDQAQHRLAR